MRTMNVRLVWIVFCGLAVSAVVAQGAGFKPIFDGKTLDGWKSPDMSYWSVQDGAITARATQRHPVRSNQFLVWQFGQLDDFELKLKYRISGTKSANSGIQIRSHVAEDGHAVGYQADIDLAGRYAGALYDEHGRGMLAERGQKTIISPNGDKAHTPLGDADALMTNIKKGDWNDYHIIARSGHIVLKVNGKVTAEVLDNDTKNRDLAGVLALQLHSGPPMTVQFKDIRLKRLNLQDRKKIVLMAGRPSHGYAGHEHNAGCLLLADRLNENVPPGGNVLGNHKDPLHIIRDSLNLLDRTHLPDLGVNLLSLLLRDTRLPQSLFKERAGIAKLPILLNLSPGLEKFPHIREGKNRLTTITFTVRNSGDCPSWSNYLLGPIPYAMFLNTIGNPLPIELRSPKITFIGGERLRRLPADFLRVINRSLYLWKRPPLPRPVNGSKHCMVANKLH